MVLVSHMLLLSLLVFWVVWCVMRDRTIFSSVVPCYYNALFCVLTSETTYVLNSLIHLDLPLHLSTPSVCFHTIFNIAFKNLLGSAVSCCVTSSSESHGFSFDPLLLLERASGLPRAPVQGSLQCAGFMASRVQEVDFSRITHLAGGGGGQGPGSHLLPLLFLVSVPPLSGFHGPPSSVSPWSFPSPHTFCMAEQVLWCGPWSASVFW